ncbi:MAG: hypothetical protein R3B41_02780 [Candidatus Doudnabacteria bacterium]
MFKLFLNIFVVSAVLGLWLVAGQAALAQTQSSATGQRVIVSEDNDITADQILGEEPALSFNSGAIAWVVVICLIVAVLFFIILRFAVPKSKHDLSQQLPTEVLAEQNFHEDQEL